jgi:hypothetical protein
MIGLIIIDWKFLIMKCIITVSSFSALNKDWCRHVERERMKKNDAQKDTNL